MPTTTDYDPTFAVWALQTRTDESGGDVEDSSAREGRLVWSMYTEGVRDADHFQVTEDSPTGMTVVVGSGVAFSDIAVVSGDTAGQGNYGVMLDDASDVLTVPAADLTNPRIDEVYLVIMDDPGAPLVKARLSYRRGDPAGSPSDPGPDGSWDGYLLLATVAVGAGVTTITDANITDERPLARLVSSLGVASEVDALFDFNESANQAMTTTPATIESSTLTVTGPFIAVGSVRIHNAGGVAAGAYATLVLDGVQVSTSGIVGVNVGDETELVVHYAGDGAAGDALDLRVAESSSGQTVTWSSPRLSVLSATATS